MQIGIQIRIHETDKGQQQFSCLKLITYGDNFPRKSDTSFYLVRIVETELCWFSKICFTTRNLEFKSPFLATVTALKAQTDQDTPIPTPSMLS